MCHINHLIPWGGLFGVLRLYVSSPPTSSVVVATGECGRIHVRSRTEEMRLRALRLSDRVCTAAMCPTKRYMRMPCPETPRCRIIELPPLTFVSVSGGIRQRMDIRHSRRIQHFISHFASAVHRQANICTIASDTTTLANKSSTLVYDPEIARMLTIGPLNADGTGAFLSADTRWTKLSHWKGEDAVSNGTAVQALLLNAMPDALLYLMRNGVDLEPHFSGIMECASLSIKMYLRINVMLARGDPGASFDRSDLHHLRVDTLRLLPGLMAKITDASEPIGTADLTTAARQLFWNVVQYHLITEEFKRLWKRPMRTSEWPHVGRDHSVRELLKDELWHYGLGL